MKENWFPNFLLSCAIFWYLNNLTSSTKNISFKDRWKKDMHVQTYGYLCLHTSLNCACLIGTWVKYKIFYTALIFIDRLLSITSLFISLLWIICNKLIISILVQLARSIDNALFVVMSLSTSWIYLYYHYWLRQSNSGINHITEYSRLFVVGCGCTGICLNHILMFIYESKYTS